MLNNIKEKLKQNKNFYHTYLVLRFGWKMIIKRLLWILRFKISCHKTIKEMRGGGHRMYCVSNLVSSKNQIC